MTLDEMKTAAVAMLDRSYCPYSHFQVGAVLECSDGTTFTGCNIENAAYGPTICAERTAAVKAISEGYSFLQDVGVVSYEEAHYRQSRYMANVAGAGFDAHVVRKLSHLKKKGHRSRWRYTWCLVKNFFRYKSTGVKVWVDDRLVYNNLLLSAAIGICKFNGGGIQQLPAAVADDGMLDLSLIRPVHFWHLLFRFQYLFNGGIYRIRRILQERGSRIRIESSPEVSVEIDGEPLGHTPLEFSILHRAIRIVVARDFYQRCAAVGAETPAG